MKLAKCNAFAAKRKQLILPCFRGRPNALKFQELFESTDPDVLMKLAKFTQIVMKAFAYEKAPSPIRLQLSYTTRAGRVTQRPVRLADSLIVN